MAVAEKPAMHEAGPRFDQAVLVSRFPKRICVGLLVAIGMFVNSCATHAELRRAQIVEQYFKDLELDPIEGIWVRDDYSYEIAILRRERAAVDARPPHYEYDYAAVVTYVYTRQMSGNPPVPHSFLLNTISWGSAYSVVFPSGRQDTLTLRDNRALVTWWPTGAKAPARDELHPLEKEALVFFRVYPGK